MTIPKILAKQSELLDKIRSAQQLQKKITLISYRGDQMLTIEPLVLFHYHDAGPNNLAFPFILNTKFNIVSLKDVDSIKISDDLVEINRPETRELLLTNNEKLKTKYGGSTNSIVLSKIIIS